MKLLVYVLTLLQVGHGAGFSTRALSNFCIRDERTQPPLSTIRSVTTSNGDERLDLSSEMKKPTERKELIRQEGGIFAFDTKYGALNPFAIYYGFVAIFLGIPWFAALTACQLFYFVTRNKIDKQVMLHPPSLTRRCSYD